VEVCGSVAQSVLFVTAYHLLFVDVVCGCIIGIGMTIRSHSSLRMHWWKPAMDRPKLTFTHKSLLHLRRQVFAAYLLQCYCNWQNFFHFVFSCLCTV